MKKIYVSILAATLLFTACNTEPDGDAVEVAEKQTVSMETPEGEAYSLVDGSKVSFYGATPTHGHTGDFYLNSGNIYVKDGAITGGNISINIVDVAITTEGLEDKKKGKLRDHLLGEDFFSAEAHPEITFQITEVASLEGDENNTHTISGNLSMNGTTNNLSFPANVNLEETSLGAKAKFVINRKDWGMSYKNDESLGDDWIYDKVEMTLDITAAK